MAKRTTGAVIVTLTLAVLLGSWQPVNAADYWGKKLSVQPTQFIFGYGSLINTPSSNSTAGKVTVAIPVRVSPEFGYIRAWVARSPSGFTALGLRKPAPGEKPETINGVLYPVDGADMTPFDNREKGYVRIGVPLAQVEAVSWQAVPRDVQIWVYVPVGEGGEPGAGLTPPNTAFPLLQSYIDVVIDGALEFGPDYAREFVETTRDWSEFWLNDRQLARRPWIFDTNYSNEDRLLSTTAPASEHFKDRQYPEVFGARYFGQHTP